MTFENINLLHVVIAGVAAWLLGFAYYSALSGPWQGVMTPAEKSACQDRPDKWVPFAVSLGGSIMMAYVLAALLNYVAPEAITVRAGLISAFFVWLGFILPPIAVNGSFAMRNPTMTMINLGYWLLAALLQGALLGAFASGAIVLPF